MVTLDAIFRSNTAATVGNCKRATPNVLLDTTVFTGFLESQHPGGGLQLVCSYVAVLRAAWAP